MQSQAPHQTNAFRMGKPKRHFEELMKKILVKSFEIHLKLLSRGHPILNPNSISNKCLPLLQTDVQ